MRNYYGFCRSADGQRRVTTRCSGESYVCPNTNAPGGFVTCARGCICNEQNKNDCKCVETEDDEKNAAGDQEEDPCAFAPAPSTRLQACDPNEGEWIPSHIFQPQRCGSQCAICGVLWRCNRRYCDPSRRPKDMFRICDGPACAAPSPPACSSMSGATTTFQFR